jgi:hypothetical protein
MRIFLVSTAVRDDAPFLAEILTAFGLCFHEQMPLPRALEEARPGQDVLVLSRAEASGALKEFLRAGGRAVAFLPESSLEELAGMARMDEREGFSRVRFVQPVCRGARGEALWTHGARRVYEAAEAATTCTLLAHSFEAENTALPLPAITEHSIGVGTLVIYAYDLVACITRLRQGYPERANFLPPGQLTPRLAFLQTPNPPPDTFWRPTADLHALAFCGVVKRLLERSAPVPELWHLPGGADGLLIFSGDEDAAPLGNDEEMMGDIERYAAAMNLYIFPGDTSMTKEAHEVFSERGHHISVHPYLSDTAGEPPAKQIAEAESQVRLFREKFDQPVRTVRNHSYMWPGYLELPELWEKLNIGMDCNSTSTLRGDSPAWGPYAKLNAAMPLRFRREDGTLIDVFQQPTQINDDLLFHPTSEKSIQFSPEEADAVFERLLDDATRVDHSPICVNFHPSNYVQFSAAPAHRLLSRANAMNLPTWTVDRWHRFWRARSSWRFQEVQWDGNLLRIQLGGEACDNLVAMLPLEVNGRKLKSVSLDSTDLTWTPVVRRGHEVVPVELPGDRQNLTLLADYSV